MTGLLALFIDTLTARLNARRTKVALYTQAEIMRMFRLNPLTLRRWRDRGLIVKVRVSPTGYLVREDLLRGEDAPAQ